MDKFLRTISAEVNQLVEAKRSAEAIYALEDTISWSLVQLALIWATDYTDMPKAERLIREAIKLKPGVWQFHVNLAHVLNLQNVWHEAKEEANKAVLFSNGQVYEAFYNLAVILTNLGDHQGAIDAYHICMKLSNDKKKLAYYNISASLLMLEQWKEGWETYENRFETFPKIGDICNRFKKIYKRGDDAKGKKIYIFSEQGVGDLIQFARLLPFLKKETGAELILESQAAISDLLRDGLNIEVNPRQDGIWPEVPKDIDYAMSICSLPPFFNIGEDTPVTFEPYIKAPKREIPDILKTDKIKVGICWAGNADHTNDAKRSMYLSELTPILLNPNIALFSLQKNMNQPRAWQGKAINLLAGMPPCSIIDLGPHLNDFTDTAFYIDQMDLIISVDTSIIHLAGAMNKPTWMMIDKHNDWRWGLKGTTTPWYPSIRIFRQQELFNWMTVVQEVQSALVAFVNQSCQNRQQDQKQSVSCDKID